MIETVYPNEYRYPEIWQSCFVGLYICKALYPRVPFEHHTIQYWSLGDHISSKSSTVVDRNNLEKNTLSYNLYLSQELSINTICL